MMRMVILLSCMCFGGMVLLLSPVISFAPSIVVSVVRVHAATKVETMISAKKAVQDTIYFLEEVTEAVTDNLVPDETIADALAKAGIAGAAAVVASLQQGHTKKGEVFSKAVDDSDSFSQEVTAAVTDNAIPDAIVAAALTSLQLRDTKMGTGSTDITPPVTLSSQADTPADTITAFLAELDLDSTLSLSPAAARISEAPLSSSPGEEVTAAMKNNVAPDATMALALASTGIAGAAVVVSSFQRLGMNKSKGSSREGDDSFSLSQEVTAAMANNAMPDATMVASLASAGIAGAAAVVSYLQGGKGIGAFDIPPPVTLSSVFEEQIDETTATSAESDLDPTFRLSSAAVKTATVAGLQRVTSSSSSSAGKPAAAAPVSGASYLETLSGASKPAAETAVSSGSYLKSLLGSPKPAAAVASVSGGSYLDTLSGATKPAASIPERPSSSVKWPTSPSSAKVDFSIDTVSTAAEQAPESPAEGDREMQGVIERLKTELELASEFFALNTIKSAPCPIPPNSDLSPFFSKDAALESASVDTMSNAVQGSVIADSSPVAYESATADVDASSSDQVEATRVPPREVIGRLITELELARTFFSLNMIKAAPHPIPRGSVSSTVVLKDAGLEAASFDTLSNAVQGSLIADSSPVAYESAAAAVDATSAAQVEATRVPPTEAIERLVTELELAREFLSLNTIKSAPRPIPRGSVSSTVVLKDASPEVVSFDTLSAAVQGSLIAESSPVAYESATAAVDAASAAQVVAPRVPPREVIERLITELELAREFLSLNAIKSAPRPIPRGSVSRSVILEDAGPETTSFDTLSATVQGSLIAESSPVAYESASSTSFAVDGFSAAQLEANRVPPREVIERLKTELELAREFLSLNMIKSTPRPIPRGFVSSTVVLEDACPEIVSSEALSAAVQGYLIPESNPVTYEFTTDAVDESSAAQMEATRVPQREVIERLKTELELAREFFSLHTIKSAPRPMPRSSVLNAVLSKDAGMEATSVNKIRDAVQDVVIADSSPVAYESAAAYVDASGSDQVEATRVPPREVIGRLITELELARTFFSLNMIKSAPRPIARGSVSSNVVLKDAGLETASFDTLSNAVQGSLIAASSPVAYESAAAAVNAASAAQVVAPRIPPREVIERLKTELELAREFLKSAPHPISRGSVSSTVVLRDASPEVVSFDTLLNAAQGTLIADSSPMAYEFAIDAVDESSDAQVEATRVPQEEVIERLKTELELARKFFSLHTIKSAPRPMPPSYDLDAVLSKDAGMEATSDDKMRDAVQDRLMADSSPVAYESAAAAVDASSAAQVEATRVPPREVIGRLITELELAREFLSLNTIKSAPRPIPRGSVASTVVLKDASPEIISFDTLSAAVQGSLIAESSPVAYESATSTSFAVDGFSAAQVEATRVPPRGVIERLIAELELAYEFLSLNTIKSAPRPIPRGSVSRSVILEDAGLETTSSDTLSAAVQGSLIAESSPVAYESDTTAVDASSASQVEAALIPPAEVIERLKTELELAREFFSLNMIKSAPRPIPRGYISSAVVLKDAGLETTSSDTSSGAVQGFLISDSSPVAYESATAAVDASSAAQVDEALLPPSEVIDRLKTELELACDFFSLNTIKLAPRPIQPGSASITFISKDAAPDESRLDKPALTFDSRDENTSSSNICSMDIISVGSTTTDAFPATSMDELSSSQVKASRVEVTERLKLVDLARDFIAQDEIKRDPHPIPPSSVSSAFVSKGVDLAKKSFVTPALAFGLRHDDISSPESSSAVTMSVGWMTTDASPEASIDESSASQVKATRFEAMVPSKRELDLARDFIAQNEIKRAPHPIPPCSILSTFMSKDASLVETPSAKPASSTSHQDDNISSPGSFPTVTVSVGLATSVASPATSIDESSTSQVRANRFEVVERLRRELDLARVFIAQNERKRASHPIAPGSISSAFVSKCVGFDETRSAEAISSLGPHDDNVENVASPKKSSAGTMSVGSTASDASLAAMIDESRTYQTKTSRVPRIDVMERLKHELDLALEFFSYTTVTHAPHPIPPCSAPEHG